MSFSGLKTAVSQCVATHTPDDYADIAASFERAVVDLLVSKAEQALRQTGHQTLIVAGGVGANQELRHSLKNHLGTQGITLAFPPARLCTDNGAMIAYAGWCRLQQATQCGSLPLSSPSGFTIHPRWNLHDYSSTWQPS